MYILPENISNVGYVEATFSFPATQHITRGIISRAPHYSAIGDGANFLSQNEDIFSRIPVPYNKISWTKAALLTRGVNVGYGLPVFVMSERVAFENDVPKREPLFFEKSQVFHQNVVADHLRGLWCVFNDLLSDDARWNARVRVLGDVEGETKLLQVFLTPVRVEEESLDGFLYRAEVGVHGIYRPSQAYNGSGILEVDRHMEYSAAKVEGLWLSEVEILIKGNIQSTFVR